MRKTQPRETIMQKGLIGKTWSTCHVSSSDA